MALSSRNRRSRRSSSSGRLSSRGSFQPQQQKVFQPQGESGVFGKQGIGNNVFQALAPGAAGAGMPGGGMVSPTPSSLEPGAPPAVGPPPSPGLDVPGPPPTGPPPGPGFPTSPAAPVSQPPAGLSGYPVQPTAPVGPISAPSSPYPTSPTSPVSSPLLNALMQQQSFYYPVSYF